MKRKPKPEVVEMPFAALTTEEKAKLRKMLSDPLYLKMLGIVQRFKPGCKAKGCTVEDQDAFSGQRAAVRLAQIQGWEMYQVAIFAIFTENPIPKILPQATYPDSGRVDAEWGSIPPNSEPKKQ